MASMMTTAITMATLTPRYLPRITAGRLIGLLTTVRTVLFSISRLSTAVATKAASSMPQTKTVPSPTSSRSLSSPVMPAASVYSIEKFVPHAVKTISSPASSKMTK